MQGEATMLLFAHSDDNYMMRSERRASYNRAPRRRRKRPGGFIYGLVAIIVSIIIWPLGMVMLWARRLKWGAGVKLIASALTLILCMCWIGFALTVQTGDPRITYIQDKVNAVLADSAGVVTERSEKLADDVNAAGGELLAYASRNLPAAAGWVNDTIHAGWEAVTGLFGGENDDRIAPVDADVTATPEPSSAPSGEPEPTATPKITAAPTPTPEAESTPEVSAGEPSQEPTEKPTVKPTAEPTPTAEPVEVAKGTPAPARVTARPTRLDIDADPTPAPTIKPAGQATVYHSSNGKCYHMASSCIGMSGAPAYTLEDSISAGFRSCGNCNSPSADILSADETVVWLDESNIYHTSDECPDFNGLWSLVTITDACEADAAACSACGASSYAPEGGRIAEASSPEPTVEPTAEPTEEPTAEPTVEPTVEPTIEPTPEPTPEPEPTIDASALTGVKSAGEATVYYTSNGVAYHRAATCVGMSGAKAHTLSEAVEAGYRACGNCQAPAAELLSADEPVMWVDESGVFHATDECDRFDGKWTLMTITDAYASGCTPCPACCAAEAAPETTPAPAAEATPAPVDDDAPAHKSAGEAIVYHTSNGRSYHVAERCGSMSGAKPYTLAESIADGYGPCGICAVPDPAILDVPVVWLDASGIGHVSDECEHFEGRYTLMSIYDACSENVSGCPYCGGESYIAENRARLMDMAKSVTVYYNDGSTYYHTADSCKGMPTADAHTLYDAIEKGLKWCPNCEPVKLGDLDSE